MAYTNITLKTKPTELYEVNGTQKVYCKPFLVVDQKGIVLFDVAIWSQDGKPNEYEVFECKMSIPNRHIDKQQVKDLLAAIENYPSLIETLS